MRLGNEEKRPYLFERVAGQLAIHPCLKYSTATFDEDRTISTRPVMQLSALSLSKVALEYSK